MSSARRRIARSLCLVAGAGVFWLVPAVAQAAPTPLSAPSISGTAQVGQTLTLTPGTYTGAVSVTDQWQSCAGATCSPVGTGGTTYVVQSSDVGNTINVAETATAADTTTTPATSNGLGPVTAAPPPVPVNSGLPTITGAAQVGQTLTASAGTWSNSPTSYTYTWESCTTTCTTVKTTTASTAATDTYAAAAADVGKTIDVSVVATNAGGSGAPAKSASTAPVAAVPANSVLPSITGIAQEGQTLTASAGTWSNTPTSYTYTWESCTAAAVCTAVKTTTASTAATDTYVPVAADVGKTIDVSVVANNTVGPGLAAKSLSTLAVVPLPPASATSPTITGAAQQGQTLTASAGTWSNAPTSYTYLWQRCNGATCSSIKTTTASPLATDTYVPTSADVGQTIMVQVTAANLGGSSAAATSLPTATVLPPTPSAASAPTLSGTPQQGDVLTEQNGAWTNGPTSFAYQWLRCDSGGAGCSAVPGATAQSYGLTAADVGHTMVLSETASNGGPPVTARSAPTAVIGATSATSLAIPGSAPATNQTVTLVATVNSSSSNASPSGSITFFSGSSPISGCINEAVTGSGQSVSVNCHSAFGAGSVSLTAVYTRGSGSLVASSGSSATTLNITKDSTSISLAVTKKVVRNKRATYTASVLLPVSNSGPVHPTGSMEFLDAGKPIRGCLSQPLNAALTATCGVTYKSLGNHKISARYSGDSDFNGSASPVVAVKIVVASSGAKILGFIGSTAQWTFYYHPKYTQVTVLTIFGITQGMKVTVACRGGGCPFKQKSVPTGSSSTINLMPMFRRHRLRVGAQITVRITRPNWVGKYYSFTVRAGRGPVIVLSCLGVGQGRPGVGC